MATDVELRVNGKSFAGWKEIRVTRGIETIAGSFELGVSERWGGQANPWPINEEDACVLLVRGARVITGYVDSRRVSYSAEDHSLRVTGRDRSGALVDCSAMLESWEFDTLPILTLAQKLAKPFGIVVSLDPNVSAAAVTLQAGSGSGSVGTSAGGAGKLGGLGIPNPPKKFSIDPGESAFEVLDRACRMAGVLPISDGLGGILLTRAGTQRAKTDLIEGQNILAASADFNASARYRRYIVSAQHPGTDDFAGAAVAAVRGEAQDMNVRRSSRVLLIRPEASATPQMAQTRAAWESTVRAARGDSVSVTIQGWTQADGTLWPVNGRVRLHSDRLGINGTMLITQAVLNLTNSGGMTTDLTLRRPDAFLPEPNLSTTSTALWKEVAKGV